MYISRQTMKMEIKKNKMRLEKVNERRNLKKFNNLEKIRGQALKLIKVERKNKTERKYY